MVERMGSVVSGLRDGTWVNAERLLIVGLALSVSFLLSGVYWQIEYAKVMPDGEIVLATDFLSFWMAAKQVIAGYPAVPYDIGAFIDLQEAYNEPGKFFTFFYPPTYLLLIVPLGFLSSIAAYVVFQSVCAVALAIVLKKIARHWLAIFFVAGTPAGYMTLMNGQNGFLTAFLFGAGLLSLKDGRPVLAGLFIGLLTIKPQLGLLIPFALVASRYWTAFLSAAATTLAFAAASWLALGTETWAAFIEQIPAAQVALTGGYIPIHHFASVFGTIFGAGGAVEMATMVQTALGVALICVVIWIWHGPYDFEVKAAILLAASTLVSPFILVYDLALLSLAIAFLASLRDRLIYPPWCMTFCAFAILTTVVSFGMARAVSVQIGPLAGFLVLVAGLKIAAAQRAEKRKNTPSQTSTPADAAPPVRGG